MTFYEKRKGEERSDMMYRQITLDKLKRGQKGTIVEINIKERKQKKHLLDMGLTKGTIVKVKKVAPMGDPVSLELRDYELCVSKKELSQIVVRME